MEGLGDNNNWMAWTHERTVWVQVQQVWDWATKYTGAEAFINPYTGNLFGSSIDPGHRCEASCTINPYNFWIQHEPLVTPFRIRAIFPCGSQIFIRFQVVATLAINLAMDILTKG